MQSAYNRSTLLVFLIVVEVKVLAPADLREAFLFPLVVAVVGLGASRNRGAKVIGLKSDGFGSVVE
jgi:hypothetical protein